MANTPGTFNRWIVDPILAQLTQGITPRRIALSLAVGSLCAFFPILGIATPLCLAVGFAFRLNQPVIQIVNGVTAPLYPLVVIGFIRVGETVLGAPHLTLNFASMTALLQHDRAEFLRQFGATAAHALLGWAVLAPAWIVVGYCLFLSVFRAIPAKFFRPA